MGDATESQRDEGAERLDPDPTHLGDTVRDGFRPTVLRESSSSGTAAPTSRSTSSGVPIPPEVVQALDDPLQRLSHYVLVAKIGSGGMGTVWKAWDLNLLRWVAIKFLNSEEEESIRRFEREAQLAAQLRHPNIAAVHEVDHSAGRHFLVMDFIDGVSIGSAKLELRPALKAFVKVCRAVEYAHRCGIIHRDIKPANIMMARDGEPYVTDFGLAKIVESESTLSSSGTPLGTPVYMSPEQAVGDLQAIDERSDVYSLGATLYTLLTGKRPFEGDNLMAVLHKVCQEDPPAPRSIRPEIPEELEQIILQAMRKIREARFPSPAPLADRIEAHLRKEDASPPRAVADARAEVSPPRSLRPLAYLGAILVVAAALLAVLRPWRKGALPQWDRDFHEVRGALTLADFDRASPDLARRTRSVLATVPPERQEEVLSWLRGEVERLPRERWPRKEWMSRRESAQKMVAWCDVLEEALRGRGGEFERVLDRTRSASSLLLPVAEYRGAVTLKIYASPYAEVRAFRCGSRWLVREGEIVPGETGIVGDSLFTPLGIRELDIADCTLMLAHPDFGEKACLIEAGSLHHGGTYIYSGSWDEPASFRLRALP